MVTRRKLEVIVGCLLLLVGTPQAAPAWRGIEKIDGQSPVTVVVEGKSRNYFRVTPRAPLSVELKGPARVRVISRAELPADATGKVVYTLRITEGKHVLKTHKTETEPSRDARPSEKGGMVGQSRQTIVNVKKG